MWRIIDTMQEFIDRQTGVRSIMCEIAADTELDLPTNSVDRVFILGTFATTIDTGDIYKINSAGVWILQPSENAFSNVYTKAEIDAMIANYYTKTEADDLFEWITVLIKTDTMPLSFISDGTPLTSLTIKGNGQQQGTPSPQNILPFDGTGERTRNLAPPYSEWVNGYIDNSTGGIAPQTASLKEKTSDFIEVEASTSYTFSRFPEGPQGAWRVVGRYNENKEFISRSGGAGSTAITFTTTADTKYVRVCCRTYGSTDNSMLNSGSTTIPYEPYGNKIPLTNASITTPLYLGEVTTVRRIKKMILNGTETVTEESANVYSIPISDTVIAGAGVSTHFAYDTSTADGQFHIESGKAIFGYDDTLENFKAFLADQYVAGTPVTVWYVLATPETAIDNEPLCKIGTYCDELTTTPIPTAKGSNTLSVDTTLQPSEMTITGKIRGT